MPIAASSRRRNDSGAASIRDQARRTVFLFSELRILVNVAAPSNQFVLDLSGSLPNLLLKIWPPRLRVQRR